MNESSSAKSPRPSPAEDRLDSWKEIAVYLNRDVTTVQRWEKREGMPVHRHLHERMGSVYAYRAELDAWTRGRILRPEQEGDILPAWPPTVGAQSASSTPPAKWKWMLAMAAIAVGLACAVGLWFQRTEHFWRSPLLNARFQALTEFDGAEQAVAVSRDGQFVAFLSARTGPMDVWITQVGSSQFHNLTHGSVADLDNPSVRTLGFSPDGSLVTFWLRERGGATDGGIGIWGVPILGGEPSPYLEGLAEYDWSRDGSRLVYHTPGAGDPLFVSSGRGSKDRLIFRAPAGIHNHFPFWSPDSKYIYFVHGSLPDKLDIWRIRSSGGKPERITSQNSRVTYPALLDRRTLMYLATNPDGSGPWLYSMDVERRIPHQLSFGLDCYRSLAVSADGRRLVATLAHPKRTLWRLKIGSPASMESGAVQIPLTTSTGFSPRLGPDFLLYVSATGSDTSIWKLRHGTATELWRRAGAQALGGPSISADGRHIAFSYRQNGQTLLNVMQADGTNDRTILDSLYLEGAPAWAPDRQSITVSAYQDGVPKLFRVPLDGHAPVPFVRDYSVSPTWSPDGTFVLYSGPDIGTTFSVKAATMGAAPHPLPSLLLTRGARHIAFLPGQNAIVFLRGGIQHKNLWLVDLDTGAERQMTDLPAGFDIRDFDVSPGGGEIVVERVQERSDVVLIDLRR